MSTVLEAAGVERLTFLHDALAAGQAIAAADHLGLIARLHDGPADVQTVARDCAISERGARMLLAALAGLGLVEVGAAGYRVVPQPAPVAALLASYRDLEEAVRTGGTTLAAERSADAQSFYPAIVAALAEVAAPAAELAAERLVAPPMRALDVGAGAAPWSLALVRRDPECQVVALDLPAVLPATRAAVAAASCEQQFTFVAGDFFDEHLDGNAYDLVIAGNICHLFDEAANRRLLDRLLHAMRPGGRVALIDVLPNEGLDGPRAAVLYGLGLLLRTRAGQVYPFSTYVGWLRDTGFEAVERVDLGCIPPLSLISARKPG